MESSNTRVRINFTSREIEVEGPPEYVDDMLNRFADKLQTFSECGDGKEAVPTEPKSHSNVESVELPAAFGEYIHSLPRNMTEADQALIAGYFVQARLSDDKTFTTKDVNEALREQGIKLSNASACIRRNTETRRVFVVAKGNFRVSQSGMERINEMRRTGEE